METIKNFIENFPEISSRVFAEAERCGGCINDNDRVAHKIIRRLERQFSRGHRINGRHLATMISREIGQARNEYEKRKYNYDVNTFSSLTVLDDGGIPMDFEPQDVLANVEDIVEYRESERSIDEKIARLATDDKHRIILKAWSDGIYRTKEIAGILANTHGGNVATHIRYIDRFKDSCEKSLPTILKVLAN